MELIISETFGVTLQGEGRSAGRPAFFVRLGLCNLDCKWCDTPYTWDWTGKNGVAYERSSLSHMSVDNVLAVIPDDCQRVVISGGEPMIQRKALVDLISRMPHHLAVEIETNGTLDPSDMPPFVHFNVSPKLSHSGVPLNKAINIDVLQTYRDLDADFKFVVSTPADIDDIRLLQERVGIDSDKIWIMPEGRSAKDILREMEMWFALAADNRWNLSTRLHVLAFNDKRGV